MNNTRKTIALIFDEEDVKCSCAFNCVSMLLEEQTLYEISERAKNTIVQYFNCPNLHKVYVTNIDEYKEFLTPENNLLHSYLTNKEDLQEVLSYLQDTSYVNICNVSELLG